MAKETHVLKPGQSVELTGSGVLTVVKSGLHKQGDEPPQPTVMLEFESGGKRKQEELPVRDPEPELPQPPASPEPEEPELPVQ